MGTYLREEKLKGAKCWLNIIRKAWKNYLKKIQWPVVYCWCQGQNVAQQRRASALWLSDPAEQQVTGLSDD